jgi:predicted RNase H-like HicB family nuclease
MTFWLHNVRCLGQEALRLIREATDLHIEGLREEGQPVPALRSEGEFVAVGAA